MDDKTLQALTALAQKLGTTAEYLWGVLLRQAPIDGVVNLVMMAAWLALAVFWVRFVRRKTTPPAPSIENSYPCAEWTNEGAFFAWLSVAAVVWASGAVVTSNFAITIAALVNPEYWALMQILK